MEIITDVYRHSSLDIPRHASFFYPSAVELHPQRVGFVKRRYGCKRPQEEGLSKCSLWALNYYYLFIFFSVMNVQDAQKNETFPSCLQSTNHSSFDMSDYSWWLYKPECIKSLCMYKSGLLNMNNLHLKRDILLQLLSLRSTFCQTSSVHRIQAYKDVTKIKCIL